MIEHGSLDHYISSAVFEFGLGPGDRVLQFASWTVDTAGEEIFGCLASGATLLLPTDAVPQTVPDFMATCDRLRTTVLDLPTAYWHELADALGSYGVGLSLPASLRLVIIGGEKARRESIATWQARAGTGVRIVNTYGPTEATIVATLADISEWKGEEVPIGKPVADVFSYVLDRYLRPVSEGVPGELYIGGAGVGRGYFGRPELTAAAFIPDPFTDQPGARMYRTGDVVRTSSEGCLAYIRRSDHQVKIRGFRVEPEEVEAELLKLPGVRDAAVVLRAGENAGHLAAYVVFSFGERTADHELRSLLSRRLPDYMIPAEFVPVDILPRSASGKVDRESLARRISSVWFQPEGPARTPVEEKVASIWAEVLHLPVVPVDADFFALGGDSMRAVQIMSRLSVAYPHGNLQLRSIFENPTVAGLARLIGKGRAHEN
jgi:acyl-coenzyme A synthetase/AMP-(fatty) acid ligase